MASVHTSESIQNVAAASEELATSIVDISTKVGSATDVVGRAREVTAESVRQIGGLAEAGAASATWSGSSRPSPPRPISSPSTPRSRRRGRGRRAAASRWWRRRRSSSPARPPRRPPRSPSRSRHPLLHGERRRQHRLHRRDHVGGRGHHTDDRRLRRRPVAGDAGDLPTAPSAPPQAPARSPTASRGGDGRDLAHLRHGGLGQHPLARARRPGPPPLGRGEAVHHRPPQRSLDRRKLREAGYGGPSAAAPEASSGREPH